MGWLRSLAAVVTCGVLLAGCSDDGPGEGPSPSPRASTTAPVSPTPSAAPTEPVLPSAAKEATEAGARAFIAYYWDLINYAQVTGDVKGLEGVSGPKCQRCKAGIDAIRTLYASGGRLTDAHYEVRLKSVRSLNVAGSEVVAFEIHLDVSNQAHQSISADGVTKAFQASAVAYIVDILWAGRWRLDVMERA